MERIKQALDKARNQQKKTTPERSKPIPIDNKITYHETNVISVPQEMMANNRVISISDDNMIATSYKVLRTQILQRLRLNDWNSLAITSPNEGAGKTLTALNLAISLAREVNHTVLLVDLDLRRPSIHTYFPDVPVMGISDYLVDDVPLNKILINPDIERLVILPGNKSFANSSETLSSPKMLQLVEELKERYPSRIVLFDLPPVLASDDVLTFSPYVDATLLVVEDGKTQKKELKRAAELLESIEIIGTVLNKAKTTENSLPHFY